jgi:hypothetical protein
MKQSPRSTLGVILLLIAGWACSRKSQPDLIVEIPTGFSGNFSLEMGIKDAPALAKHGDAYVVTVSKSGKVSTSTLLMNPHAKFSNSSGGAVWGYSDSVFTTGDGIPVGGKIEFFVGTRKDFEAEESRKNHSSGAQSNEERSRRGA